MYKQILENGPYSLYHRGDVEGNNYMIETSNKNDAVMDDRLMIMCLSIRGGVSTDITGSSVSNDNAGREANSTNTDNSTRGSSSSNHHENEMIPSNTNSTTAIESDQSTVTNRRKKRYNLSSFNSSISTTRIGEKLSLWKNETTEKAKKLFLEKITLASTLLLKSENEYSMVRSGSGSGGNLNNENELEDGGNDDEITRQSNLLRPGRSFHIVTTAAIPWFTGTAVNPLLRAAYFCRLVKKINSEASAATDNDDMVGDAIDNEEETILKVQNKNMNTTILPRVNVTLVIPWLELEEDRIELYGEKYNFASPQEQEQYIRTWLREEADMPEEADKSTGLQIIFYPARYHSGLKSIFAMGDIVSLIVNTNADVCILEEPEHLNFYRAPGDGWTKKFNYVIGIIHTNYVEYASSHYSGLWTAPAIRVMSSAMVRAYCHVVVKLSGTLQTFAEEKERISNVHGVRSEFLKEGLRRSDAASQDKQLSNEGGADAYFIGKLLWTKGLDGILEMQSYYKRYTGKYFPIDIYGNGPDERAIKRAFLGRSQLKNSSKDQESSDDNVTSDEMMKSFNDTSSSYEETINIQYEKQRTNNMISHHVAKLSKHIQATTQTLKSTTESIELELPQSLYEYRRTPIPAKFPGRVDHAVLKHYKVFVNPSLSEVLCTTTAEALAMGKFVIIPVHPSNEFFMQFPNCLAYRNKLEFAASLSWALSHDPEPLTPEQRQLFTWEAATDRLVQASAITRLEAKERQKLGFSRFDERIAWFHNEIGNGAKGDILRKVFGAGPAAEQVKYAKRQAIDSSEEDDEGLSMKFVGSSLADALRETFSTGIFSSKIFQASTSG